MPTSLLRTAAPTSTDAPAIALLDKLTLGTWPGRFREWASITERDEDIWRSLLTEARTYATGR